MQILINLDVDNRKKYTTCELNLCIDNVGKVTGICNMVQSASPKL